MKYCFSSFYQNPNAPFIKIKKRFFETFEKLAFLFFPALKRYFIWNKHRKIKKGYQKVSP